MAAAAAAQPISAPARRASGLGSALLPAKGLSRRWKREMDGKGWKSGELTTLTFFLDF